MKKAIVIGINGQDGSYISEWLIKNNYEVLGWVRPSRISSIDLKSEIPNQEQIIEVDMTQSSEIEKCLNDFKPDEIYNLASPSRPHESWKQAINIGDITAIGVTRILEAILKINPKIRYYQASTSEMFGSPCETPQDEKTPFAPRNPYGVAKLYAHWMVQNFRYYHNLFAVSGILFNHESPRRGLDFVTRKISRTAAQIKLGMASELRLGDLEARRDWGYAPEYVQSMWLMLQQDRPGVYVIGSGETHSVREFCQFAFAYLDLDYQQYIRQDEKFLRPKETIQLVANPNKAREILGWEAKTHFKDIVEIMVSSDLEQLRNETQGQSVSDQSGNIGIATR